MRSLQTPGASKTQYDNIMRSLVEAMHLGRWDRMDESDTRSTRITRASRRRREEQKEELRQLIITAAGQLFVERGYTGFSMRQLAEQIGYAPATLYLYFRDKDDLLFTVVDEGFARFGQALAAAAMQSDDPWTQLDAMGRAYVTFGIENPAYYQLMFIWRVDFLTAAGPGDEQTRLESFLILQRTVQAAMEAGHIRNGDAETISDALWAQMHGIVTLAIAMPGFEQPRLDQLLETSLLMARVTFRQD